MSALRVGTVVRHQSSPALGEGVVKMLEGGDKVLVKWATGRNLEHTLDQLVALPTMVDRLADAGEGDRSRFVLQVLARWFETRHRLTGELADQPFEMLPHQVVVTNTVVSSNENGDGRAWLIADDVGLGKTIEAGMILEVLRQRQPKTFRALVVVPAGLVPQWQDEMSHCFHRDFAAFSSRDRNALQKERLLIASIDTLKKKELLTAIESSDPWDLVIFDEAHHLATESTVLAHKLANKLRVGGHARNVLFLTATPHSGKNHQFVSMMKLLRDDFSEDDIRNGRLKQLMIRNQKSAVTDTKGRRIFLKLPPAHIRKYVPSPREVAFYEELQEFLRSGYGEATRLSSDGQKQQGKAVGFTMSTFAKLASSSRAAIRSALANRLSVIEGADPDELEGGFSGEIEEHEVRTRATTGSGKRRQSLIRGEAKQVKRLLEGLEALDAAGIPDTKLVAFVDGEVQGNLWVKEPKVKLLIFTEYRSTQRVLVERLEQVFGPEYGPGVAAVVHGGMSSAERQKTVKDFNEPGVAPYFLVSTEAGGEGLNMQRACHTIVNYDLPWNPIVLQQRIGRVYRYGQTRPVVVVNLQVDSDSKAFADQRVHSYLEKKLEEVRAAFRAVGDDDDVRSQIVGMVSEAFLGEVYKKAIEFGEQDAKTMVDAEAVQLKELLDDDTRREVFKGTTFSLEDYEKVKSRVSSNHVRSFLDGYLRALGCTPKEPAPDIVAFDVPEELRKAHRDRRGEWDTTQMWREVDKRVERAALTRDQARLTGAPLFRFGHPVFDTMIAHAQNADFGRSAASLRLPAEALGIAAGECATWSLFETKITKQYGLGTQTLHRELVSVLVPAGGEPRLAEAAVEALPEFEPGSRPRDLAEPTRAWSLARAWAEARAEELKRKLETDARGGVVAGVVKDVVNVAIAWVEAS